MSKVSYDYNPYEHAMPVGEPLKYEEVRDRIMAWDEGLNKPLAYADPQSKLVKAQSLASDAASRKASPLAEGVLYYFPNALAEVATVSKKGNDQHNPGQPLHWSRGKSSDHADCIMRHLVDAGTLDGDGMRHSAKVAWRALALLQEELERETGAPLPRNARYDTEGS